MLRLKLFRLKNELSNNFSDVMHLDEKLKESEKDPNEKNHMFVNDVRISIVHNDITKEKVDAIGSF